MEDAKALLLKDRWKAPGLELPVEPCGSLHQEAEASALGALQGEVWAASEETKARGPSDFAFYSMQAT